MADSNTSYPFRSLLPPVMIGVMSRRLVCIGLFTAWAVHDTEEVLTASRWSARTSPRLLAEGWPPRLVDAIGSSTPQFALAAALVGVAVLIATIHGVRTGGDSEFFQAAVLVFGWHGAVHIAQALIVRDYIPGLATVFLLVIPYTLVARRVLGRPPVPPRRITLVATVAVVLTVAAQSAARFLIF